MNGIGQRKWFSYRRSFWKTLATELGQGKEIITSGQDARHFRQGIGLAHRK
jgi:hypothetical protein